MSRKKIDIWKIESESEILSLRDYDFLKEGVSLITLKNDDLEGIMIDIMSYIFIFRDLFSDYEYSLLRCRMLSKVFELLYPLVLLAVKKVYAEFHLICSLKQENEKLRKELTKINGDGDLK